MRLNKNFSMCSGRRDQSMYPNFPSETNCGFTPINGCGCENVGNDMDGCNFPFPTDNECFEYCNSYCDIPINCVSYGTEPLTIYFMATVEIPQGFILGCNDYATNLAVDESGLIIAPITQQIPCGPSNCTSNRECIVMNGVLNYVASLAYFKPACPIIIGDTVCTSFSSTGTILVDKMLACTSANCGPISSVYTVSYEKCEEFITSLDGKSIYRDQNEKDFYAALNNPDIVKVVNIPYKLVICSQAGML